MTQTKASERAKQFQVERQDGDVDEVMFADEAESYMWNLEPELCDTKRALEMVCETLMLATFGPEYWVAKAREERLGK